MTTGAERAYIREHAEQLHRFALYAAIEGMVFPMTRHRDRRDAKDHRKRVAARKRLRQPPL